MLRLVKEKDYGSKPKLIDISLPYSDVICDGPEEVEFWDTCDLIRSMEKPDRDFICESSLKYAHVVLEKLRIRHGKKNATHLMKHSLQGGKEVYREILGAAAEEYMGVAVRADVYKFVVSILPSLGKKADP